MSNLKYIENEDFKIPGNWERFIKHFQEKFWNDPLTKLATESDKIDKPFIKSED